MANRVIRYALLLIAVVAATAAAYLVMTLEQQAAAARAAQQQIEEEVGQALVQIAELQANQRGYVAAGQGFEFWATRVAESQRGLAADLESLQRAVAAPAAGESVAAAVVALENFGNVDARAREFVELEQALLASDLIFSDGLETTAAAAEHVTQARTGEREARQTAFEGLRRRQAWTAAGGGGALLLLALVLTPAPGRPREETDLPLIPATAPAPSADRLVLSIDDESSLGDKTAVPPIEAPRANPSVAAMAGLCTELGRVTDVSELRPLLARAVDILQASGLVLWLSDQAGQTLRPTLAHGYSNAALSRMHALPRDDTNATAQAFRSGVLEVVSSSDFVDGAVVAPLITPGGCVGALAVEVRDGSEQQESVQAMITVIAAQLATLVGGTSAPGVRSQTAAL